MSDRITREDIDRREREELNDMLDEFIKHNKINSEEKLRLNTLINIMTMAMTRIGLNKKGIRLIKLLYAIEDRLNAKNDIER